MGGPLCRSKHPDPFKEEYMEALKILEEKILKKDHIVLIPEKSEIIAIEEESKAAFLKLLAENLDELHDEPA